MYWVKACLSRLPMVLGTAVMLLILLTPGPASAQRARPPIDIVTSLLFGVETSDACMARIRIGFQKAGYTNVVDEPTSNGVKGEMTSGDFAGTISMASCIVSSGIFVAVASSGKTEAAATLQSNKLLVAINAR